MTGNGGRVVGLIGHPVGHSISPVFQQAAFDALGLPYRYEAWDTRPEELPAVLDSLRAGERVGANVTVPHKEAVARLIDTRSPEAGATGAVNTVVRAGGRLHGHNTDIPGFLAALREDGGFDPAGVRAVVLGAGGAARAVAYALLSAGAATVRVHNRTPERAAALVAALGEADGRLTAAGGDAGAAVQGCDLIVNCTTLGMAHGPTADASPLAAAAIPPGAFVCDIVANPLVTPLLAAARARGCRTLGGLPMLVRQGAAAFTLWTGQPAPVAVMLAAARRAMRTGD
jgi:shikimate dehydrogenase